MVQKALAPIAELMKRNPDSTKNDVHVWGPADQGDVTYRFTMRRAATKNFRSKLEAKPKSGDSSQYVTVMAGGIHVGDLSRRGSGILGIDADAFWPVSIARSNAKASRLFGFVHGPSNSRALAYRLKNFTLNVSEHEPVTARFGGGDTWSCRRDAGAHGDLC